MATVPVQDIPTVDLQASNVVPFSGQGVEQWKNYGPSSPESMIAGGKAFMAGGKEIMRIADQMQDDLDDATTRAADNIMSDKVRQIMYDPESGYMGTIGRNALDKKDAAIKDLNDLRVELTGTLNNDTQRKMFARTSNSRVEAALGQLSIHSMKQLTVFNIGETTARSDAASKDAIIARASFREGGVVDPNKQVQPGDNPPAKGQYQISLDLAVSEAKKAAMLSGIPADSPIMDGLVLAVGTKVANGVVKAMVAEGDYTSAREYLNGVTGRKEIDPEVGSVLLNLVKSGDDQDESIKLSMILLAKYKTLPEQQAALDAMYVGGGVRSKVFDATGNRLKGKAAEAAHQTEETTKTLTSQAYAWVEKNKGAPVENMPIEMLDAVTGLGKLPALRNYATEGRFVNNDAVWAEIITKRPYLSMTPTQFYNKYRGSLDNQHIEAGYALINHAKGGGDKERPDTTQVVTINEAITRAAKINNIIPTKGTPSVDDLAKLGKFEAAVQQGINALPPLKKGEKLTTESVQRIIDKVLLDSVKISTTFGSDIVPVSGLSQQQREKATVIHNGKEFKLSDIPQAAYDMYAKKMTEAGRQPNAADIVTLWKADEPARKTSSGDQQTIIRAAAAKKEAEKTAEALRIKNENEKRAAEAKKAQEDAARRAEAQKALNKKLSEEAQQKAKRIKEEQLKKKAAPKKNPKVSK
jgi:hypothetical protein